MQQVLQNIRNGQLRVAPAPDPVVRPGQVLIANACSLISAGIEKMIMELARKSLIGEARDPATASPRTARMRAWSAYRNISAPACRTRMSVFSN